MLRIVFSIMALGVSLITPSLATANPYTQNPIACPAGFKVQLMFSSSVAPPHRSVVLGITPDSNGDFTVTGVPTQTDPGNYHFAPQSYLSVAIGGDTPQTSRQTAVVSNGIATGNVKCYQDPNRATYLGFTVWQDDISCAAASAGQVCSWFAIYEPGYYTGSPSNAYWVTNAALYNPPIPRCTAPAPSTAPATVKNTGHLAPRCMRKFTFVKTPPYSGNNSGYNQQIQNGTAVELFPPN